MKMRRTLNWILATALVVMIGALAYAYLSGDYHIYFVRSESMTPNINLGDIVVDGPVNGTIEPGTIITYELAKGLVTHRVVSSSENSLVTKGDANDDPDPRPVTLSQVKGLYMFRVPFVGYVSSFVRTKQGWFLAIVIPAMVLVALIVKDILKEAFGNSEKD